MHMLFFLLETTDNKKNSQWEQDPFVFSSLYPRLSLKRKSYDHSNGFKWLF